MKRYYLHSWKSLFAVVSAALCLLSYAATAHAFPATQCAADRKTSDLNCTAKDVQLTNISVASGQTSCVGGTTITLDLDATVNFGSSSRYDIGIFIANDGKNPQLLSTNPPPNTGAASCNVSILSPATFQDLDSSQTPGDICGDGSGGISGISNITNVALLCQAASGSGNKLYIPFVVTWAIQDTSLCTSNADPFPYTTSKCNSPTTAQGTVEVVVLPTITKTDNKTTLSPGDPTTYYVVITNTTGVTLSGAVFKDPAVANLTVANARCSATTGGATCPCGLPSCSISIASMQGSGITIPDMPNGSSVTFEIDATLVSNPTGSITNTATVTVGSATASANDTVGGKRVKIIKWREVFQ